MNTQELINKIGRLYTYGSKNFIERKEVIDLVKQLDEPKKVTVPQFVTDYIEYAKEVGWDLLQAMKNVPYEDNAEFRKWFYKGGNVEVFTRAWLDGCEVEQEKRYLVKVNAENCSTKYLVFGEITGSWLFAHDKYGNVIIKHTRKELEEAGFGWVFDCPGIEIEEVE